MLRIISARSSRPARPPGASRLTQGRAVLNCSVRAWTQPTGFPDRSRQPQLVVRRHVHAGRSTFSADPRPSVSDDIRREILQEGKLFAPPLHDASTLKTPEYKAAAKALVAKAGELIMTPPQQGLHDLSRTTISANLLQAVHTLAHAQTVMIVTGRNTAEGKVTIDGPVSAAVAAHVLFESRKVAVIMSDATNQRLIQKVLEQINPECARYVKYLPINEVNGRLFGALSRNIVTHKPDVTLFIDVPGRNINGDYLDETGKSIGISNVAFDQALNIQNSQNKQTIAICRSANNAGIAEIDAPVTANGEDIRARLYATLPLVTGDIVEGTLALMELVGNACTEMNACTPKQLETMLKTAIDITESKTFIAPAMRRVGRPREPLPDSAPVTTESWAGSMTKLKQLQSAINTRPVSWPASLDKLKLEGPETRHAALYDSSDGVLIATDDFLGYIRARSRYHLKTTLVADHNKASYGDWSKEELFHIVVDGMVFSAMLGPDVIVLVCNTACTVDLLRKVRKIVEDCLREAGRSVHVEMVDLIGTVSSAIVEKGGSRPVLLATEGTARSGKYKEAVKQIAQAQKLEEPDVQVIACGDKANRPGHDLAGLVNKLAHLRPDDPDYLLLLREIDRVVEQIPLDATSIWLCCTHFPILMELIRKALNVRLVAHGLPPDSIPIIDPIEFQAEATIALLQRLGPSKKDYSKIPEMTIFTTGLPGQVKRAAQQYINRKNVPVIDKPFPRITVPKEGPRVTH
jgi:glutamate racemase